MTYISRYQKRLSGPRLDRIDIHVEVPRVPFQKLSETRRGEPSREIRAQVEAARARQAERFGEAMLSRNAEIGPTQVRDYCQVDETSRQFLGSAMRQVGLSARAYHRVLKLALAIADLAGDEGIGPSHIAEALQYRPRRLGG